MGSDPIIMELWLLSWSRSSHVIHRKGPFKPSPMVYYMMCLIIYTHSFVLICLDVVMLSMLKNPTTYLHIFYRVPPIAVGQLHSCSCESEVTLSIMGKSVDNKHIKTQQRHTRMYNFGNVFHYDLNHHCINFSLSKMTINFVHAAYLH